MSNEAQRKLELAALVFSLLLAIGTALGSFYLLPYRLSATETDIRQIKAERAIDHDTLTRIDGRTDRIEKALDRLGK